VTRRKLLQTQTPQIKREVAYSCSGTLILKAKEQMKNNEKGSDKSMDSVLDAIQKFKAEDKAKSTEAKKSDKQNER
jgi:hypothetical protein